MMQLTEQTIRNLYFHTLFTRGKRYYLDGSVQNLIYDSASDTWYANVNGSRTYRTRISLDEDHVKDYCNCPAYPTYGQCKHVCATLLAISDAQHKEHSFQSNKDRPSENRGTVNTRYRQAEALIGFFDKNPREKQDEPVPGKRLLKTEFLLRTFVSGSYYIQNEVFDIRLKVGDSRLYVVRNMREFLDAVVMKKEMEFGKNFTFDPRIHTFSTKDREVIDKLIEIEQTEAYYDKSTDYWSSGRKGKELMIPPYAADDLLLKLQHLNCKYEQQDLDYDQLELVTESLPFSFSLEEGRLNEYQLKVTGSETGYYYDTYGWYGENGVLYKLSEEQRQSLQPFREYMGKGAMPGIPISAGQVGAFVSGTLPRIEQIGEVTLSEKVSDIIISHPLVVKLFVDGKDDGIDVNVEYHYDSIVIDPLNETEKSPDLRGKILVRDNEREQEFMEALEDSPLKVNVNKLYTDTEESLYEFLYNTLPILEKLAEVYLTSSIKSMILPSPPSAAVSVNAPADADFLEVDFTMDGIDPEEIPHILKAVTEKRRYVRLPGGAFLPLRDEALGGIADLHQELDGKAVKNDNGTMELPLYRGLQVEE